MRPEDSVHHSEKSTGRFGLSLHVSTVRPAVLAPGAVPSLLDFTEQERCGFGDKPIIYESSSS